MAPQTPSVPNPSPLLACETQAHPARRGPCVPAVAAGAMGGARPLSLPSTRLVSDTAGLRGFGDGLPPWVLLTRHSPAVVEVLEFGGPCQPGYVAISRGMRMRTGTCYPSPQEPRSPKRGCLPVPWGWRLQRMAPRPAPRPGPRTGAHPLTLISPTTNQRHPFILWVGVGLSARGQEGQGPGRSGE